MSGARVTLLEANGIGWGASGRNFGQVVPYLRHPPAHTLRHFGPDIGERLIAAAAGAPNLVFDLIQRHGIECEAVRNGLLFAAHTTAALEGLQARRDFWRKRGVDLSVLNRGDTAQLIGGGSYVGSLLDPRGGTVNTVALARGLAREAIANGAAIHTQSNVLSLKRSDDHWLLTTRSGAVRAKAVVLATNAYTDSLWPGLAPSIVPMRIHQLATAPIDPQIRATILPGGQALTDTRRMASGIRLHQDGRIHVSTDGPWFSGVEQPDEAGAAARLARLFPQLGPIKWDYRWSGWVAMTPEEYPRLHRLGPDLFAALGYSGRGIGLSIVFGRELSDHIAGKPAQQLILPLTKPRRIGIAAINQLAAKTVIGYKRARDRIDAWGHR